MSYLADLRRRYGAMAPQLKLFLIGMALLGMSGGIFETTFNNFLDHAHDIHADTRGFLEFPRELPGFLTALFAGMLFFLPETRIAVVCSLATGLGMIGIALFGLGWWAMIAFMILWSSGTHLLMPIRSSLAMELAHETGKGRRLGQISAVGTAAAIAGCAVVYVTIRALGPAYEVTFLVGGGLALLAAVAFWRMRMPGAHLRRPRFVWRRAYWLYYVLAFLFGARKQIFITFGPWVLVRIFDQPATIFAILWAVASGLGIVFHPWLGRIIDRYGERAVLMADSVAVLAVCLGYGFSSYLHNQTVALYLLYACFVCDQLLFGVNMARSTYLSKIAVRPEDVSPTLSLGITINHAVSMSVPSLGGLIWMRWGHAWVFLGAAGVAALMFVFSALVQPRRADE